MKHLWVLFVFISSSWAHEHSTPWIDSQNLENGLYVSVSPPWVVRKEGDFPVSIQIRNIDSKYDVVVEEIRLLGELSQEVAPRMMLRSQGDLLQRVQKAKSLFENGGAAEEQKEFVDLLSKLNREVCTTRWMVAGETDSLRIEIDVLESGKPRTIRKTVMVNKQPTLPRGGSADVAVVVGRNCEQTVVIPRSTNTLWWFAGDQHIHT